METIAQEAKRLLEPIPEENWITDAFTDGSCKCCAIGHYERLTSKDPDNYSFSNCYDGWCSNIRERSEEYLKSIEIESEDIASINNGDTAVYTQETPKQRVMALLDDMIKAGY